jgi:hypothetical protein
VTIHRCKPLTYREDRGGAAIRPTPVLRRLRSSHHNTFSTPSRRQSILVPEIDENIEVKLASTPTEWDEAFRLVADNYRARGYESNSLHGLRFTNYHALPDTAVFVAKREGKVVATLSLVCDTHVLGLPMECIFGEEIDQLRAEGLRLAEVSSLADRELPIRQFVPVFATLTGLMTQWGIQEGVDLWLISVNPRHRAFYRKVMGFLPLGPSRSHPSVLGHPAEAYKINPEILKHNAPKMHQKMLGEPAPREVLDARPMSHQLIREFASSSTVTDIQTVEDILNPADPSLFHKRWHPAWSSVDRFPAAPAISPSHALSCV